MQLFLSILAKAASLPPKAAALLPLLFLLFLPVNGQAQLREPDRTVTYAVKDGAPLQMDYYAPTGVREGKPAILFVFGGGFISGARNEPYYKGWFAKMSEEGYPVLSIDYRLGLVGVKAGGLGRLKAYLNAVQMGVDDLFSATLWLCEHGKELGVDADNLVISGSSAGAMIVVEAEWELANRAKPARVLPESFRYKGVMSFAGAILSREGKLKYARTPAPMLLLHGTADKVVNYKKIRAFNWGLFGSDAIARTCRRNDYPCQILRYTDHGHDIASMMAETWPDQRRFLEDNVIGGAGRKLDSTVDDPRLPKKKSVRNRKELYAD